MPWIIFHRLPRCLDSLDGLPWLSYACFNLTPIMGQHIECEFSLPKGTKALCHVVLSPLMLTSGSFSSQVIASNKSLLLRYTLNPVWKSPCLPSFSLLLCSFQGGFILRQTKAGFADHWIESCFWATRTGGTRIIFLRQDGLCSSCNSYLSNRQSILLGTAW